MIDGDEVLRRLRDAPNVEEATRWAMSLDGPIAAGGFEPRAQQRDMALAVARRMDGSGWSFVEAPCGVGKGLGYLIPGVIGALRSERATAPPASQTFRDSAERLRWKDGRFAPDGVTILPVVVSTANISLQEQLATKDVPGLARALGVEIRAVVLKGRGNYACLDRVDNAGLIIGGGAKARQVIERAKRAVAGTEPWSGDRDDLDFDVGGEWAQVASNAQECHGESCSHFRKDCFADVARAGLSRAHVLILNHHYLALLHRQSACLLAVDEAHELEGALRGVSTSDVTRWSGKRAFDACQRVLDERRVRPARVAVERFAAAMDDALAKRESSQLVLEPGWCMDAGDEGDGASLEIRHMMEATQVAIAERFRADQEDDNARAKKAVESLGRLCATIDTLATAQPSEAQVAGAPGAWAIFATRDNRDPSRVTGTIAPAVVEEAARGLADRFPAAVLTSATLRAGGTYAPLRAVLGVDPVEELTLSSPFPLATQGLLVVPDGPSPKDRAWPTWAVDQVVAAVQAASGRTLVLASTHRQLREYAQALSARSSYPVRAQGDAGRAELRRWFGSCVDGVLVASRSFFQGLDVVGESCSCVVIDRVPFAPPGDPIEEAVSKHLAARTRLSPFMARAVPLACTALAQGSGRLIRSMTDRGVVVVLDNRILDRSPMGRALMASVPPFPVVRSLDHVAAFLAGEAVDVEDVVLPPDVLPFRGGLARRRAAR